MGAGFKVLIKLFAVFALSSGALAQMQIPNLSGTGQAPQCNPSIAFDELTVDTGTLYRPCASICRIDVGRLIMEPNSGMRIPADCEGFTLDVDTAQFAGGNVIYGIAEQSDRSVPPDASSGPALNIRINYAELDFPTQSVPPEDASIGRFLFQDYLRGANSAPPFNATGISGVMILSVGEAGAPGAPGAKGAPARRKGCNRDDGAPAGNGQKGGTGGIGGTGGLVQATVTVSSSLRNNITANDILLVSQGGPGGAGGPGGPGGDGASPRGCACVLDKCAYKRSGFGPGQYGPGGDIGPPGKAGETQPVIVLQ